MDKRKREKEFPSLDQMKGERRPGINVGSIDLQINCIYSKNQYKASFPGCFVIKSCLIH